GGAVAGQRGAAAAGMRGTQPWASPPLAGLDVRRQEQIARELDALAVEGHGLQHRSPRQRARDSFGSYAVFVDSGKYRGWTRPTILAINDEGEDRGGQGC